MVQLPLNSIQEERSTYEEKQLSRLGLPASTSILPLIQIPPVEDQCLAREVPLSKVVRHQIGGGVRRTLVHKVDNGRADGMLRHNVRQLGLQVSLYRGKASDHGGGGRKIGHSVWGENLGHQTEILLVNRLGVERDLLTDFEFGETARVTRCIDRRQDESAQEHAKNGEFHINGRFSLRRGCQA